jgi:two-component system, NarL family, sensor kinase
MTATTVDTSPSPRPSRLTGGGGLRPRRPEPTLARLFARFALTGLVAMLIIGAVAFFALRDTATSGAVREATQLAELAGRGIAEPELTRAVLAGEHGALERLDRVVRRRILSRSLIVRVKIWNAAGTVIYSDARSLIGRRFELGDDELHALRNGTTDSDTSDLSRPENMTERGFHRLIEVYVGIRAPDGQRLLYEDYERSSTISSSSQAQWEDLLPELGGALLVLYLIQLPLAFSLARRLRDRQREREQLLQRAIEASDLERRRIAADLHDGAVQRLAGVSISLAAAARANDGTASTERAIGEAAAETRETIRELRTLLVDIYPETLRRSGLAPALNDLVAPLSNAGTAVTMNVSESLRLPPAIEALLYRVAQEAIRNVRAHGQATEVALGVETTRGQAVLVLTDNGRGFTSGAPDDDGRGGHFGLRLMRDLVDHAGGQIDVRSAPGEGTTVHVEVPLR